ncbi:DUF1294 domain-containing protein [Rhizobium sp. NRK18]|uniref:DUF1294 domain-containing protein n=1 Tax=Rhizobium sp. NRK18 TaxID=2964667 RepID=UPI0021C433C0|nr:DUF1294 domain-containing protein [Rhizobium sp. NRK18]MCQ2004516.1 DUF1294 domain-containing protein [Rhizobium sp. NRK18]
MPISYVLAGLAAAIAYNAAVYLTFLWDKLAAIHGHLRIRESTLLWLAFLGGSPGALIAQQRLRHKTRKEPFRSYLAAIAYLHIVLAAALLFCLAFPELADRLYDLTTRLVAEIAGTAA